MTILNRIPAAGAVLLASLATSAQAAPLIDDYIGGNSGGNALYYGDVVTNPGNPAFNIDSMEVNRSGDDLSVVINTNYIAGASGTSMGSLFLGEIADLHFSDPLVPGHPGDTFVADPGRFGFVFDFTTATNADLYELDGDGLDVVKSHFGGIPTATNIRQGQAVDIVEGSKGPSLLSGTWSTIPGTSITFLLEDYFNTSINTFMPAIYQTSFTLAWAMSCANDVILKRVVMSGNAGGEVPLPAGVILLLSGLTGLGCLSRFKARKAKATI